MLAAWYMDDGCLVGNTAVFCSESFGTESVWKLFYLLVDKGYRPTVHKKNNGYRISLGDGPVGDRSASRFFKAVGRFVPPSMRYKLPPDAPLYDSEVWEPQKPSVVFDEVRVERRDPPANHKNSYVYCLEVEGNHNFVVSGVVVHNCTATNEPVLERGADIIWADVKPDTGEIDPDSVELRIRHADEKVSAIICVHWGGYPCDLDSLNEIGARYGIPVIEDAAHAFGAVYKGRLIGSVSRFTSFSFQAIKQLTTVDGGLLTCAEQDDYERGKLLRWYGICREGRSGFRCEPDIREPGYKFHMNDVNATIGIVQLRHVDEVLAAHRGNALFYDMELSDVAGVEVPHRFPDRASSYWLYTILVDGGVKEFEGFMGERGVQVSPTHKRNDVHTMMAAFRGASLPGVDEFERRQVSIPVGWWVSPDDRVRVVEAVKEWSVSIGRK
jgi:dTDP-4-amino-4,6-dideoxygalactose transaminase